MAMKYVGILVACFVMTLTVVVVYRIGVSAGRRSRKADNVERRDTAHLKASVHKDNQIRELQTRNDTLNELNGRYLKFLLNISTAVQRLNSTMNLSEIISSITRLVSDIITADIVELYVLDAGDNLLKPALGGSRNNHTEVSYALGEGLVGKSARDRIVTVRGRSDKGLDGNRSAGQDNPALWMAAPVTVRDSLVGVIAIGQVRDRTGDEAQLIKVIADIAGVALLNQASLGEAKQEANTDPLTGLANRRFFFDTAQRCVEKSLRDESPISVFLFDIDNFKAYNDTNGHDRGDILLKELAGLVRQVTRKSSVVARYGGEEFIVLLPGILKDEAFVYADRLRHRISCHPFPHREGQPLSCISISGGVASYPIDGGSINEIIRLADAALYEAKSAGRNRVVKHTPFLFSDAAAETAD
jgi:diguanylate cyclase (GGDEF)-like protein